MTLPSATLFPHAMLPLYIFEPRYRQMLADSLHSHRMFSVAMQKPSHVRESPSAIAGLGLIRASVLNKDGTSHLIIQGLARVALEETVQRKPYRIERIRPLESHVTDTVTMDALVAKVRELVAERLERGWEANLPVMKQLAAATASGKASPLELFTLKHFIQFLDNVADPDQIADLVSCTLLPEAAERQTILETVDLEARLKHLIHFLMAEIRRNRKDGAHE